MLPGPSSIRFYAFITPCVLRLKPSILSELNWFGPGRWRFLAAEMAALVDLDLNCCPPSPEEPQLAMLAREQPFPDQVPIHFVALLLVPKQLFLAFNTRPAKKKCC
jgi:hypothetical protein